MFLWGPHIPQSTQPPPAPQLPVQQRGRSALPFPVPSPVKLQLPLPRRSKYIIYTLLPSPRLSSKESGQREITPLYNLPPLSPTH